MAENFNLIFGSQAPTTASWSDADYQTGWNVVGSTPPTAEQFDALQNRADKKAQELNNRMLPLEQKAEEQGRQASTAYTVGAAVTVDGLPADWLLVCTTAGTSGTVAITLPTPLLDGATINDGTITWTLRKIATNGSLGYRQPSTAYTAGQIAYHASLPTGYYLECTTAGTTGSGDLMIGSEGEGGTITDGTVVWTIVNSALQSSSFGKSIINHLLGSTLASLVDAVSTDSLFSKLLQKALEAAGLQYNIAANGYICFGSLFGGLILQWGLNVNSSSGTVTVNFPISMQAHSVITNLDVGSKGISLPGGTLTNGFQVSKFALNGGTYSGNGAIFWIAVGH